ncbi:MAG: formylglycine-generating enzyme family protein [Saprospiraceae bacterium]|nr:formylglycine-generating enzyme family protein [Saprospiraceae bacterium]
MLRPLRFSIQNQPFFLLPIEGGLFDMGMEKDDPDAYGWEQPVHPVRVPTFYLAQYPVTQALWAAVMGREEWEPFFTGDERPMERVSWDDAQVFLKKLQTATQQPFRLPSEAEWEFAARGGIYSLPPGEGRGGVDSPPGEGRAASRNLGGGVYSGSQRLKEVGWYAGNSHGETKPVGCKFPNELGLYDMSGNVWEWCEDDLFNDYQYAPSDGSAWIDKLDRRADRVCRGGSGRLKVFGCHIAYRGHWEPKYRGNNNGLRLALSLQ